jgi:DNA polymerase-1
MNKEKKKILLIDANSFIHRSFHALPFFQTSNGKPVGAIYGLTNTLLKILKDEKPDYVIAAFDTPKKTFRSNIYKEYKANRPKAPKELVDQIIESYNLFKNIGIKTVEKAGFEGDDILGTLSKKFSDNKNVESLILTGDLDMLQLVNDNHTIVLTPKKSVSEMKRYNEKEVKERFGLKPNFLSDYKGLVGDKSDNIPGVYGVGKKTAEKLLSKYKTLENLYKNIDSEKETSAIKKIKENKPKAILSKKLATIKTDVPLNIKLDDFKFKFKKENLINYLKKLEFKTLVKRIENNKIKTEPFSKKNKIINPENFNLKDLKSENKKIAYSWKKIYKKILNKNIEIKKPIFDINIASWIIDPDKKLKSLNEISDFYTNRKTKDYKESIETIYPILNQKIKEEKLLKIYEEIELPLIEILAKIENTGIKINIKELKKIEEDLEKNLEKVKKNIYKKAGEKFNIKSPRQVGKILFEKLKIENKHSKTKSGQYRTSEKILKGIEDKHSIVKLILEHRELSKIKNTYVKPILKKTKKGILKTTLLQTNTGTGRLSSENPNLQNIPQKSKWSKLLRKCFTSQKNWSLVSFDYSQMELRILAHVTEDRNLLEIFKNNKDVHTETASKILEKNKKDITPKDRRLAKTLNFGIIYGMGSRAFSEQSGLSIKESKMFINKYFDDFKKIKEWQNKIIKKAKNEGFIRNENKRMRYIKQNWQLERIAINMPIQSLGADIIKKGMIEVYNFIKKEKLIDKKINIILSIHDELILEISDDILNDIIPKIKKILEKKIYKLKVPLIIDVTVGKNWNEMKKKT